MKGKKPPKSHKGTKKKPPARKKAALKKPPKKTRPQKPVQTANVKTPKRANGIPETLRDVAVKTLDGRQAEDIVTVDLTGRSSLADYLIIASGRNARQVAAMAGYLRDVFQKHNVKNIRTEGRHDGNWTVVDAGDVIVHLFRPEVRRYYNLEGIWDGADKDIERSALLLE